MRVVSGFDAEPPLLDGSRWVNEWHIVAGKRHAFRWLCHRRIDPRQEMIRRAHEFAQQVMP